MNEKPAEGFTDDSWHPIHLIIPFRPNETSAAQLCALLTPLIDELVGLRATIRLCGYGSTPSASANDGAAVVAAWNSRTHAPLMALSDVRDNLPAAVNHAFLAAASADVILLHPDTLVMAGSLLEMVAIGAMDPMFGFVSPRSNGGLAAFPHEAGADISFETARTAFTALAPRLPRFTLAPTAAGFALWIRGSLFAELGGLAPAYAQYADAVNDLVLRSNRYGYRVVLANHAFVWRQTTAPIKDAPSARTIGNSDCSAPIAARYPEYPVLLERYVRSAGYRAERLLSRLSPIIPYREIAFDFTSFDCSHNGTFEAGLRLLKGAAEVWPEDIHIAVVIEEDAWHFHGLAHLPRTKRLAPDSVPIVTAAVRIGQPFHPRHIRRLYQWAPVVGVFMLDTISTDCGYLAIDFDDTVWRFVFEESDVVFTNSAFTLDRIRHRYRIGANVATHVSRHSLDVVDYAASNSPSGGSQHSHQYTLVVGNRYAHKAVALTVDAMATAFPDRAIVAIGLSSSAAKAWPNVRALTAGHLSDYELHSLYANAAAVVFPSHYEGFGFPIMHGLARNKPVLARASDLNHELRDRLPQAANLHLYGSTKELIERLQAPPIWSDNLRAVPRHNWTDSAREVLSALQSAIARSHALDLTNRLARLDDLRLNQDEQAATMPTLNSLISGIARRLGNRWRAIRRPRH